MSLFSNILLYNCYYMTLQNMKNLQHHIFSYSSQAPSIVCLSSSLTLIFLHLILCLFLSLSLPHPLLLSLCTLYLIHSFSVTTPLIINLTPSTSFLFTSFHTLHSYLLASCLFILIFSCLFLLFFLRTQ